MSSRPSRTRRRALGVKMLALPLWCGCHSSLALIKTTTTTRATARSRAPPVPSSLQYQIANDEFRISTCSIRPRRQPRRCRSLGLTKDDDNDNNDNENDDEVVFDKFGGQGINGDDDDDDDDEVFYGKFQLGSERVTTGMYEALEDEWQSPSVYPLVPDFILRDEDDEEDDGRMVNRNTKSSHVNDDDDADDDEEDVTMDWNEKGSFPQETNLLLQEDGDIIDAVADANGGEWKSTLNPSNFFLQTYQEIEADDGGTMTGSGSGSAIGGDMGYVQQRMDYMQQQLDLLTKLVQEGFGGQTTETNDNGISTPPSTTSTTATTKFMPQYPPLVVPPVKAMLFIDGTWLYYSIHEREQGCAILNKFGRGWQNHYQVDWAALPRLICQQLEKRRLRPIDMVRVLVFTSFKATTPKSSYRFQMYQDMQRQANYDVHMMETVGKNEKCVDISLAVEMLHYATVANAFDLAILLSGDKDFMPAMIRTRQKGRQVALASMRSGCNRELTNNPHVKDFPTVWIDQCLEEWIVPKDDNTAVSGASVGATVSPLYRSPAFADIPSVQAAAVKRVILDFLMASERPRVASRDIGRYLKMLILPSKTPVVDRKPFTMLDSVKKHSGSLFQFLSQMSADADDIFFIKRDEQEGEIMFWVGLQMEPEAAQELVLREFEEQAESASDVERVFFEKYSLDILEENASALYFHTYQADSASRKPRGDNAPPTPVPQIQLPEEYVKDYTLCTLAELKERCRERELPVSGTKAALLERIRQDVEKGIARLEEEYASKVSGGVSSRRPSSLNPSTPPSEHREARMQQQSSASPSERYLVGLIEEYLQARGGIASSRDVGRYLVANKASPEISKALGTEFSALQELKLEYGTLRNFINTQTHRFVRNEDIQSSTTGDYSFGIALRPAKARQLP